MNRFFTSRFFHLIAVATLCVSVILIYSNTFSSAFHLDDFKQIAGNPRIRNLTYLPYILFQELRGVTFHTFALNYLASGLNVTGFHIVNTVIHLISAILAYFVLTFTFSNLSWPEERTRLVAFFSALLFAVHPLQTQSVTYVVQRMESLSALFCLLAILLFIFAHGARKPAWKVALYFGVLFSYVMAFYSKEIAITLPALLLLYDYYFMSSFKLAPLLRRAPFYVLLLVLLSYFVVSTIIPLGGFGDLEGDGLGADATAAEISSPGEVVNLMAGGLTLAGIAHAGGDDQVEAGARESFESAGFNVEGLGPKQYMLTQLNVITYYLTLMALPLNQNVDYDFPISTSLFETPKIKGGTVLNYPQPPPVVSLLVLLAIFFAALYLARRSVRSSTKGVYRDGDIGGRSGTSSSGAVASFFIFWFFITLSPTSSFIPIIDVIFEHRLYLASLGFFVVLVLLVVTISERLYAPSGGREIE